MNSTSVYYELNNFAIGLTNQIQIKLFAAFSTLSLLIPTFIMIRSTFKQINGD